MSTKFAPSRVTEETDMMKYVEKHDVVAITFLLFLFVLLVMDIAFGAKQARQFVEPCAEEQDK